jgi:hypothetical protein
MHRIEMWVPDMLRWSSLGVFAMDACQRTVDRWRKADDRDGEYWEYRIVPVAAEGDLSNPTETPDGEVTREGE